MPLTRIDSAFLDLDALGGIDFDVQSGVPTFSVDAANHKVGIGTDSPTGKLEVAHDSQTDLLKLKRTSGNTGTFTISLGGANPGTIFSTSGVCDDFVFIAGSERLRITSTGELKVPAGIGAQLRFENQHGHTGDAVISTYDDSTGTLLCLGSNFYFNSSGSETRYNTSEESAGIVINRTGQINFNTGGTGATAATRLRITSAGLVGVSNSVSQAYTNEGTYTTKLRVGSDTSTSNQSSAIQIGGYDGSGTGVLGAIEFFNHRNNDIIAKIISRRDLSSGSKLSAGQLDFYTDDGDGNLNLHLTIDAIGFVGINENSPDTYLHAKTAADTIIAKLEQTSNNGRVQVQYLSPHGDWVQGIYGGDSSGDFLTYTGGSKNIRFFTNNAERLRIHSSGKIHVGSLNNVSYGYFQVNQSAGNDESGIGILASNQARSMRLWCDDANNSIINSGDGGGGVLKLNEGAGQVRIGSGGLTFNGDSAATNALNDYEEGTLSWILQRNNSYSGSNSVMDIKYTKIGHRVFVSGYLYTANTGSATGVQVQLRDNSNTANPATLPYLPNHEGGFTVTGTRTISDAYRNIAVTFMKNNTRVYVYTDDGNNSYNKNADNVDINSAQTHLVLVFNGSYTTDS